MKQEDKISQLFQDSQHKLDEMPSMQIWDRLEERLDSRDAQQTPFTLKRMAVAAAVLIALSMVALWTYINPLNHAGMETTAIFKQEQLPSEIIASDVPSPAYPILMSHRERSKYLTELDNVRINTKPTLADKSKKYKPRNISPTAKTKPSVVPPSTIPQKTQAIASNDLRNQKEAVKPESNLSAVSEVVAPVVADPAESMVVEESTVDKVVVEQTEKKQAPSINNHDNSVGKIEQLEAEAERDENIEIEVTQENAAIIVMADEDISGTSNANKDRKNKRVTTPRTPSTRSRKSGRMTTTATTSTSIREEAMPTTEGIDKFDWLLGKWTDEDDNSFEEWYRTDADTIEGKGYFVIDVDTTFTQSMQIVELNKEVYFMVNGQLVKGQFQLESYDDGRAIFKNNGTTNQITLTQDAGNQLSITIEDKARGKNTKERRKKRRTIRRLKKVPH